MAKNGGSKMEVEITTWTKEELESFKKAVANYPDVYLEHKDNRVWLVWRH